MHSSKFSATVKVISDTGRDNFTAMRE